MIIRLRVGASRCGRKRHEIAGSGWAGGLTRRADRLSDLHLAELQTDLKLLTKHICAPIVAAWNAKEDLLDLLALARTYPSRGQIVDALSQFYSRCGESGLP